MVAQVLFCHVCANTHLTSRQRASRWTGVSGGGKDIAHADSNSMKWHGARGEL